MSALPPSPAQPALRRVLIVDAHSLERERLAELVSGERDLCVCGQATTRSHALTLIRQTSPDLSVLSLSLPDCDGLELVKDLRALWPRLRLLVLSERDETIYGERAVRAGAHGFLGKQEPSDHVLAAIRRILAGEIHLSDRLSRCLAARALGRSRPEPAASPHRLTDRELAVFDLIGRGWTTAEVGGKLSLSVPTVETYRARIKEKLALKDGHELVRAAIAWANSNGAMRSLTLLLASTALA